MSLPYDDDMELENDSAQKPIVTFKIKNNLYGVSTAQVQSMLEMPEIRPVPHAPACVRGLVNLRGEVLPVVDLRVRLGLPSKRHEVNEFTRLMKASEKLPLVLEYLLKEKVRRPRLQEDRITIGGKDQAWIYRETMRSTWFNTEGMADWLQAAGKHIRRK